MLRGLLGLCVLMMVACGGSVSIDGDDDPRADSGAGGSGATAGAATGGWSGSDAGLGGSGNLGGGPVDGGVDVYVDPGCPDAEPPPAVLECDPFAVDPGCPFDQACYPYVDYPSGGSCQSETYGTVCLPAGIGEQGDDCSLEVCAAGFVCVLGGAPGPRCVKLCSVFEPDSCPAGLLCEPMDTQQGFGGCL